MNLHRSYRLHEDTRFELIEAEGGWHVLAIEERLDRCHVAASRKPATKDEAIETLARWFHRWGEFRCVACGAPVVKPYGEVSHALACHDPCRIAHGGGNGQDEVAAEWIRMGIEAMDQR